jgi:probable F420-dependent oxidoreductase
VTGRRASVLVSAGHDLFRSGTTTPAGNAAGPRRVPAGVRFGIATFVTDEGIRPAALGRALEERGFDSVFLAEHSHIPTSRESPYPGGGDLPRVYYRTLDPFVTLAAMADATTNLLLGTGIVLLPQRDLIHTANEAASVDLISDGRLVFGVGAGWNREEMRNHGVDPTKRGPLMTEQLAAIKELWTKDEAEFHGEHVDFDPVYLWPKPARTPHPPIYLGGESDAALTRLVEQGDGWLPRGGAASPERIAEIRRQLADRGKPDVPTTLFGAPTDPDKLAPYVDSGELERVTFMLPTRPQDESLSILDDYAKVVERFS